MSLNIGIVLQDIAEKYKDMDNYRLENIDIPKYFTVTIDENGMGVKAYEETDTFDFTVFTKEALGMVINFNTNKPDIFGTGLRLKLVGMYDNKEVQTIYIPDETENENIYMFKDTYNNDNDVYIPESVIIKNSIVKGLRPTTYEVVCKNPQEEMNFKTYMSSLGLDYKEV